MFERRLKIFLAIVIVATAALLVRAAQVQVVERDHWRQRAAEAMKRSRLVETVRGSILDYRGRPVAIDQPCVDACVDYRAIVTPPDEGWVRDSAIQRLRLRMGEAYASATPKQKRELRVKEVEAVKADIESMWGRFAGLSGKSRDEIEDIRQGIVRKVEMRRRYVWYRNYEQALKRHQNQEPAPAWRRWLIDDTKDAPRLDQFAVVVAEQEDEHVILRAIGPEVQNELGKHIERYPGLLLRAGTHRYYPFGDAGCHLLGHLSRVTQDDLKADPSVGVDARQYYPNDLIGRTGIESLCEQALRGSRGKVEIKLGEKSGATSDANEIGRLASSPGRDVSVTIDIELQQEIQEMFAHAEISNPDNSVEKVEMHGAAVVLDVKSGQVRALASYPTFDLNAFDDLYDDMVADELNLPMLNRATQSQLEPGSTVKPIVGLAGIAEGLVGVYQGIECTGFLVLNGRTYKHGRCWTESKFGHLDVETAHHQIPSSDPHHGSHGNPDGYLAYSDALQRSCNIYFETLADRLKLEGMSKWFERFGLGRATGIGIPEAKGRLPISFTGPSAERRFATWSAGIGQGPVAATPLQMANVAATIARGGVWVRPRLVVNDADLARSPTTSPTTAPSDRVDLNLPPEAIAEARAGMVRVVNTVAGTGKELKRDDVVIAGKTGTAQASRFRVKVLDADGNPVLDDKGKPKTEFLEPSTKDKPNARAPWYRGTGAEGKDLNHAWFIGFAPAEDPQIAFAVMVEYGGSGGHSAASVARGVIEACVERGYIQLRPRSDGDGGVALSE